MKRTSVLLAIAGLMTAPSLAAAETIVFVRHGEKPPLGLGQLSCKGLNRSLALPGYFDKAFPKIDAFFAPDPAKTKADEGVIFDYVRPLATIEPTAIVRGLNVHTEIGFADTAALEKALTSWQYAQATVVVAWEHTIIVKIVRDLLASHGDAKDVPPWSFDDYDSVYVVTLTPGGSANLTIAKEGLDGQSDACPK